MDPLITHVKEEFVLMRRLVARSSKNQNDEKNSTVLNNCTNEQVNLCPGNEYIVMFHADHFTY